MSFLTIAIILASFARQSAALTRPKTGPKLALNLRGGGHIYTFRLHDKLPAPKSRVWFHATRNSGAFLACTGLYLSLLTPTAPGTTTPALDRADAFGLTMIALTAAMLRFALADPGREGFRRVPRAGVVAWPLLLAVAALA